ncbi:hypothetical protein ACMGDK_19625 [Chryseobacterium sp. DT-3]|uniref:hypothetical protein n=1 Tax=Chryseobacterium sp. DT-3 TaxID=3396164 RepID=UPI003F1D83E5
MNIIKILTTAGLVGMYPQAIAGSFDDTAYQKSFDLNSVICKSNHYGHYQTTADNY